VLRFEPQISSIWRRNGNHTTDTSSFKFPIYSAGLLFTCFSKYIALPYVLLASLKTSFSFLLGHVILWGCGRHLHWEIKSFVCTWRMHCPRSFNFSRLVNTTNFSIQSPSFTNWKGKYKILQTWLHGKKSSLSNSNLSCKVYSLMFESSHLKLEEPLSNKTKHMTAHCPLCYHFFIPHYVTSKRNTEQYKSYMSQVWTMIWLESNFTHSHPPINLLGPELFF